MLCLTKSDQLINFYLSTYREGADDMFGIFGDVKRLTKLDDICIDNNVFRLHYKVQPFSYNPYSDEHYQYSL